jgi:hypothetical protein
MLRETNAWRSLLGKHLVASDAIAWVETRACGHIGYSSRFALYCAEIALDTGPGVPLNKVAKRKTKWMIRPKTLGSMGHLATPNCTMQLPQIPSTKCPSSRIAPWPKS